MTIVRNFSNVAPGASSTGVISAAKGGTGLSSVGTSGYVLTSDGTNWTSAAAGGGGVTGYNGQAFTASGTFTIPAGVTAVKVTATGGGATGGAFVCCVGFVNGTAGGASSVSSGTQTITTITGSGGGGSGGGGSASGGTFNIPGGNTFMPYIGSVNGYYASGGGGGSYFSPFATGTYGGGGAGGQYVGGGGGGTAIKYLTGLTPGNTLTVTRSTAGMNNGIIVIEW
jgi:hypothetical protein